MPLPSRGSSPERIAALREAAGLSKAELARRIGVSPRMLSFYEQGRSTPLRSVSSNWLKRCGAQSRSLSESDAVKSTSSTCGWPQDSLWNRRWRDCAAQLPDVNRHSQHHSSPP
ncbi:helix-turn-helix domain-containing protein [Allosalinactinospora lopnorensis]|uniref:helix-turn-helix domain-containing protein n=1 Tax=Allosalinactinospora lopnorensis TaxID=1352348 RepID=UPI0009E5BB0F